MANFNQAFDKIVIPNEGKYSNDPDDRGGVTIWGLIRPDDQDWVGWQIVDKYNSDPKKLPFDQLLDLARPYYKKKYWDFAELDNIPHQELAEAICDVAINQGKKYSILFVQQALNILNKKGSLYSDISMDGVYGNQTRTALQKADLKKIWIIVRASQVRRYVEITLANEKNEAFAHGWINRIINELNA